MRRPLVVVLALAALALALVVGVRAWRKPPRPAPAEITAAPPPAAPDPAPAPAATAEPAPAEAPLPELPEELGPGGAELGELGETWSSVDLEAVRAALPDNVYWQAMAPTQDERLLREREEAKVRWNEQYGKMLSGTGTDEEIRAFYEQRQRTSTDAIQFVDYLLEHHAGDLTERDQQFLQLARRLHLARLQEIPRRLEEAFARKRQQDEARAAWLADEARFRGEEGADDAPDAAAPDDEADEALDEAPGEALDEAPVDPPIDDPTR